MAITQIRGSTQIKSGSIDATRVDSTIIIAAGTNAFTADQSHGGFKITNLAAGTAGTDAVNFSQLSGAIQGLSQKPTARAATTTTLPACTYNNGAGTLQGNSNGAISVQDGITLAANDLLLVKNQASAIQNGLYVLTATGDGSNPFVLTRHVDMDASGEVNGAFVPVDLGTVNANTLWLEAFVTGFVLGTNNIVFTQLTSWMSSYTGSNGIDVTGSVISPTYGSSANTVCQGNDARLSDVRSPVGTALTSAKVWVGNGSNLAAAVNLSGDVTISNTGVATVANQVALAKVYTRETPTGTVNGSNTVFTTAHAVQSGTEMVFVNGLLQEAGSEDYAFSSTNTITFTTAPITNDRVRVTYIGA